MLTDIEVIKKILEFHFVNGDCYTQISKEPSVAVDYRTVKRVCIHYDSYKEQYLSAFEKNDFFFFFSLYPPDYTKRNSRYLKKRHFELCVQYYSEYEMGTSDISNYSDFYRFIISNHEEDFQYLMTNGKVRTLTYQTLLPTIKEAYEFYISK